MTFTARELINDAYYYSGIVARGLQTVSGEQLKDGVKLLNDLLAVKSVNMDLLPYYKEHSFNAVIGQEKYAIDGLIQAETLVFYIGSVRYSMMYTSRNKYEGSGRVENVQSLPYNWNLERRLGGSDLRIYFAPNTAYPMKLWGKFGLDEVDENTDMADVYDKFYIAFLKYELAENICRYNQQPVPEEVGKKLDSMSNSLKELSPKDYSVKKLSDMQSEGGLSWYDVNILRGWRP